MRNLVSAGVCVLLLSIAVPAQAQAEWRAQGGLRLWVDESDVLKFGTG